jgi:hypothetical protein
MYNERRKVIKDAGNFRFIKITGQNTRYAIQYKYTWDNHEFHHVKDEMTEYLNVKNWQRGDWVEFYFQKRKECNKQFTFCVLKWA